MFFAPLRVTSRIECLCLQQDSSENHPEQAYSRGAACVPALHIFIWSWRGECRRADLLVETFERTL